jgi:hypothetical protein
VAQAVGMLSRMSHQPIRRVTRRGGRKEYLIGPLSNDAKRERRAEKAPPAVAMLQAAGGMSSALRAALRKQGIDPKLARLVLLFYEWKDLRVREVAWRLNVSPSTAAPRARA